MVKQFRLDLVLTAAALIAAFLYGGWPAMVLAAILIVVEIVFSFDNAAVNAKYLVQLNEFWQRMFLTIGVLIAVFGMRLAFPFVVVCLSGGVSPTRAVQLAAEKGDPQVPGTYGFILDEAHVSIASFGGMFLLLLFLGFVFAPDREITWLSWVERPLMRIGRLDVLPVVVSGAVLLAVARGLVHPEDRTAALFSGLLGVVVFLAVDGLAQMMAEREAAKEGELRARGSQVKLAGRAAFSMFVFLEVLDASFSFDGVIGAFAITPDPVIIAIGLGVGALFVRSMTIYLVRMGTLEEHIYLEHGAHWAIGSLAVLLLLTLKWDIPDIAIGLIGICFITAAYVSSRLARERPTREQTLVRP